MAVNTVSEIPSVKGLPLLGNLLQFGANPFDFPHKVAVKQGRLVRLQLGPRELYVVWHPEDIQKVLRDNHRNYIKAETVYPLEAISGPALVNIEGDDWLARRKQMQPFFHRKRIMNMLDLMQSAIEELFPYLDTLADSKTYVDLIPLLRELTAHVFTKTFYGISLPQHEVSAMSEAMYTALTYVWKRYIIFGFIPEWMPYPNRQKFINARTLLSESSRKLIAQRRTMGAGDDLLSMMMGLDEGSEPQFNDVELLQETISLFEGGFDTSSGTLGWVFYQLSQNPTVAHKLQSELDTHMPTRKSGETATQLTYTHQVIQETMRLYPSAPAVMRLTAAEDTLAGYRIKSNALVMVSFYAVHRHPDFWNNPEVFAPERFAEGEHKATKHQFAYVPFSSGPRMCIGDQFALYEMRLTIACLLHRYKFTLDPTYQLEISSDSTYFPKRLPMKMERRTV